MKKIYLIFLIPFLFACEEVIEIDLNSSSPEIIIEANLSNSNEQSFVYITESTDFYNPNAYKTISNADVFLKDASGDSLSLDEVSPGKYQNKQFKIRQQNQYNIEVNYKNQKYTAASSAPNIVEVDSVGYKLESRPFNKDKKRLELHIYFKDDPDIKNYIRFVVYKNGEKINRIFLYDDRLTNGNDIDFFFFNFDEEEEFKSGDLIEVELQSIDEPTFTYFKTLRSALARSSGGPFGSTAPANPTTNWTNNAFGYFSAYVFSYGSVVLE
ncbi:MAG: DUF4249 domain-containing protein [Ignavibacteriae bacterium]|nr:DUF4249 domain-containing protein [Ignavibacteriota bacterium]